jgi:hypothetical protein
MAGRPPLRAAHTPVLALKITIKHPEKRLFALDNIYPYDIIN